MNNGCNRNEVIKIEQRCNHNDDHLRNGTDYRFRNEGKEIKNRPELALRTVVKGECLSIKHPYIYYKHFLSKVNMKG